MSSLGYKVNFRLVATNEQQSASFASVKPMVAFARRQVAKGLWKNVELLHNNDGLWEVDDMALTMFNAHEITVRRKATSSTASIPLLELSQIASFLQGACEKRVLTDDEKSELYQACTQAVQAVGRPENEQVKVSQEDQTIRATVVHSPA